MMTCNDEDWCRSILADIGGMSLEVAFGHGHTLDIGPCVKRNFPVQGIVFEHYETVEIAKRAYAILRCHGITRKELEFAREHGADELLSCLKQAEFFPRTDTTRKTIKLTT